MNGHITSSPSFVITFSYANTKKLDEDKFQQWFNYKFKIPKLVKCHDQHNGRLYDTI